MPIKFPTVEDIPDIETTKVNIKINLIVGLSNIIELDRTGLAR
jgi:hypothetical protein